jgi:hypothetical protein
MSIIATDILIKTMIEGALADLRRNAWILDDIFGGLATDPLATHEYGYKEVQRAKEWFAKNRIDVYLNNRIDAPQFPCITIVQTSSREMLERTSLSDEGDIEDTEPHSKRKQIQKVYDNFTPKSYNPAKGWVTFPDGVNTDLIAVGQFLVSSKSGKAYVIGSCVDSETFAIAPNIIDDFTNAYIAPPTSLWNLHREQTFLEETFAIGLHAQSDTNQAIWLRQLAAYMFFRYKEAYLEARGFEVSTLSVGAIDINPYFKDVENVFSCPITLTGQVEANWIKYLAPKLQKTRGGVIIIDGPKTPEAYIKEVKDQYWRMEKDEED